MTTTNYVRRAKEEVARSAVSRGVDLSDDEVRIYAQSVLLYLGRDLAMDLNAAHVAWSMVQDDRDPSHPNLIPWDQLDDAGKRAVHGIRRIMWDVSMMLTREYARSPI